MDQLVTTVELRIALVDPFAKTNACLMGKSCHTAIQGAVRTTRNGDSFLSAQGDEVLGGDELTDEELRFFVLQALGFDYLSLLLPLTSLFFILLPDSLHTLLAAFD